MLQDEFAAPSGRVKQRNDRIDEADADEYVDQNLSKQILTQARNQMKDIQRETSGNVVSKKLPKLGDNMDSDEDGDDGEEEPDDDYEKGETILKVVRLLYRICSIYEFFIFVSN